MGCHAGLDVDDAEVDASSEQRAPVDDWAKTFADAGALWVANTGYGYADTDTIAYSAKLMADFAANLNGTLTIGEALTEAKQQYAAGNAILSPYDLKALMESTLYGLPMYNLNSSTGTPGASAARASDQPVDLQRRPRNHGAHRGAGLAEPGALGSHQRRNGSYFQVAGTDTYNGGTQATEFRPIEPLATVPVTEPSLLPHGALVTGLVLDGQARFYAGVLDARCRVRRRHAALVGDAAFPGTLQRVVDLRDVHGHGHRRGRPARPRRGPVLPEPVRRPGTGPSGCSTRSPPRSTTCRAPAPTPATSRRRPSTPPSRASHTGAT